MNHQIIHNFQGQNNPLRKVKADKVDSIKFARYTLGSWANLKQNNLMDELHSKLKNVNHQFNFYMKHKAAMKNKLIVPSTRLILIPCDNAYFDSPIREDGSRK